MYGTNNMNHISLTNSQQFKILQIGIGIQLYGKKIYEFWYCVYQYINNLILYICWYVSQDSSVGIVTRLRAGRSVFRIQAGKTNSSLSETYRSAVGPTEPEI